MLACTRQKLKTQLTSVLDGRDMGTAAAYSGMQIQRERGSRKTKISQTAMTQDIVSKFGVEDSKTEHTPLSPRFKLTTEGGDPWTQTTVPTASW
jgi:hypothetical protein